MGEEKRPHLSHTVNDDDGSRCKAGSGLTGSGSLSGEEGGLDQPDGDASEDAHG